MELAIWGLGGALFVMVGLLARAKYENHRLTVDFEKQRSKQEYLAYDLRANNTRLYTDWQCLLAEWNNQHKSREVRYMLLGDGSVEKQKWLSQCNSDKYSKYSWQPIRTMTKKEADAEIEGVKKEKKDQELRKTIPAKQYWP